MVLNSNTFLVDQDKPAIITATKAVNDIAFNPFNSNMFASHSESDAVVKLWDMRKMTEAVCRPWQPIAAMLLKQEAISLEPESYLAQTFYKAVYHSKKVAT